jgi:hypothetical protein
MGSIFRGKKAPPVIVNVPSSQQISNQIAPINFASIIDSLSGDKLDIIKEANGKIALTFGNSKNRVDLEKPVAVGNVNTNLPAVRQIKGRNIDEKATDVILLSQAMTKLGGVIEQMEMTSPYLIPENQDLINSYRTAVTSALDKGFDIKQHAIDQKLAKAGLMNSSAAFSLQVALAREKANAYAQAELSSAELAQSLKQQAIGNLHQRSEQIAQNAGIELNRFGVETSNQLQLRAQDMEADLATQKLEQQRAAVQVGLELQKEQQRIDTEFANKGIVENRRNRMLAAGADLFNQGNNQALGARSLDNNAITNFNASQMSRYSTMRNPWSEALGVGVGAFTGAAGTGIGYKMLGMDPTKKLIEDKNHER